MGTSPQVYPIKFEVIRNALVEATEEMTVALRRSAYSTNIKTRADFSCAYFDHQLRPVAQAFAQPNHLGSLTILVPRAIAHRGACAPNPPALPGPALFLHPARKIRYVAPPARTWVVGICL